MISDDFSPEVFSHLIYFMNYKISDYGNDVILQLTDHVCLDDFSFGSPLAAGKSAEESVPARLLDGGRREGHCGQESTAQELRQV